MQDCSTASVPSKENMAKTAANNLVRDLRDDSSSSECSFYGFLTKAKLKKIRRLWKAQSTLKLKLKTYCGEMVCMVVAGWCYSSSKSFLSPFLLWPRYLKATVLHIATWWLKVQGRIYFAWSTVLCSLEIATALPIWLLLHTVCDLSRNVFRNIIIRNLEIQHMSCQDTYTILLRVYIAY